MMPLKTHITCVAASLMIAFSSSVTAQVLPASEIAIQAPEEAWRTVDAENTLYMDLPSGRIIIELRPDFAPKHVDRIKTLTRQGFYDGVLFHRVIEGFMAQGGDPTGTGQGGSDLPDLDPEFVLDPNREALFQQIGRDARAARVGFIGPIPVGGKPSTLNEFLVDADIPLWGLHCRGVMSMARTSAPNSANSQFFLMFADARRSLDMAYTVWGRIVDGRENARRISRGEPPQRPTPIVRMRVAADVPLDERDTVQVMRTDSSTFSQFLQATGDVREDGFVEDICNVSVPSKINGKVEF